MLKYEVQEHFGLENVFFYSIFLVNFPSFEIFILSLMKTNPKTHYFRHFSSRSQVINGVTNTTLFYIIRIFSLQKK